VSLIAVNLFFSFRTKQSTA